METKPALPAKLAAEAPRSPGLAAADVPAAKPQPYCRDWRRYGCVAMLLVAAAILLALFGIAAWAWYDLSKPIGIVGPDRWPAALSYNHEAWQKGGANIEAMEVFATGEDIFNCAAILKVRDKPETWELFRKVCSHDVMESPEAARERWDEVDYRYPGWAPDLDDPKVEILPRSGRADSTMLRVARDPANETIYIDYYFDF